MKRVGEGGSVKVGSLTARVLETPGHTLDHICYIFDAEKIAFVADTLFSVGCGRVIEGTMPQMWHSLLKLRALPDDMVFHCGHEYTQANIKFALTIEPDNAELESPRQGSRCVARRRQADTALHHRRGKENQLLPARGRSVGRRRCRTRRQER